MARSNTVTFWLLERLSEPWTAIWGSLRFAKSVKEPRGGSRINLWIAVLCVTLATNVLLRRLRVPISTSSSSLFPDWRALSLLVECGTIAVLEGAHSLILFYWDGKTMRPAYRGEWDEVLAVLKIRTSTCQRVNPCNGRYSSLDGARRKKGNMWSGFR